MPRKMSCPQFCEYESEIEGFEDVQAALAGSGVRRDGRKKAKRLKIEARRTSINQ